MLMKPRYAAISYPLAVTSLCVSSQDYFARNWTALCDVSLSKLKVRLSIGVAVEPLTNLTALGTQFTNCRLQRPDQIDLDLYLSQQREQFNKIGKTRGYHAPSHPAG